MARLVDEYRGYEVWRYYKSITYYKSDGTPVKGTDTCYYAIHKEGKYPPIKHPSGGCWRRYNIEKKIDEALEQPPAADVVYEVPPDVPRKVDTYNGIDVYFYPNRSENQYYAKVAGHGSYEPSLDAAHAFIDKELYKQTPMYQEEQDRKKAEQEAALERARIYGIGTDEEGNEIPPSEEEIEARETYYAKVRVSSKADTVREAYEKREGIIPTEEEIELREGYEEAELEAQGKWLDFYWLQLKQEWRNLMGMIT